ncbi:YkgJ family cysteine cluster protein [Candidatus Woesearchaeota archaeon]|nr:YkgJ family cysteine cluster protein [Candidatus Woesearchaeota archaeon]
MQTRTRFFVSFRQEVAGLSSSKFVCRETGKCCSHIRGFVGEEEKAFFEEFAYGKLPLFQLIPIERTSFPLWDWEAKRLMHGASELGIDHKIIPSRAVYDQILGKTIIVTYSIDADSCVFLRGGKCSIYGKRAFICRLFPFQKSPFLRTEGFESSLFGGCPAIERITPKMPPDFKGMISFLHESFGPTFLNAVENDYVTSWVNSTIISLMKSRAVKPLMNCDYDSIMAKASESESIDLTQFLVEKGIYSRQEMDSIINDFERNAHAKSKLREVLGDDFNC